VLLLSYDSLAIVVVMFFFTYGKTKGFDEGGDSLRGKYKQTESCGIWKPASGINIWSFYLECFYSNGRSISSEGIYSVPRCQDNLL